MAKVDVYVVNQKLCEIECKEFNPYFGGHCKNRGGCLKNAPNEGCKYFPQEILIQNKHLLDFHQAYGVLCYEHREELRWKFEEE